MTDDDLRELLSAVRTLLRPHLQRSEPLRRVARIVGQWLVEESRRQEAARQEHEGGTQAPSETTPDARPGADQPAGGADEGPPQPAAADGAKPSGQPVAKSRALVPLTLGDEDIDVAVQGTDEEIRRARAAVASEIEPLPADPDNTRDAVDETGIDLAMIERRCRLKAESCRVLVDRRAALGDPLVEPPLVDRIDAMIAQAKAMPDCFLWGFWRQRTQPDDAALRAIAQCYDALAHAVAVARMVEGLGDRVQDDHHREAMQLLAEADSALRVALEQTWLTTPDVDQDEGHRWIRRECVRRRTYVPRFMKLDDPADPADAGDVIRQADELHQEIADHASRLKQIDEGLKKIRYHCRRLGDRDDPDPHHYHKIAEAVSALVELGVPPSDRRFRRALDLQTAASFPPDLATPAAVASVLDRIIDWHEATANAAPETAAKDTRPWSGQVRQVRSLLAGRTVVIVGGEPRTGAGNRIKDAFDLADVVWVRLTEHGTGKSMQAPIARPETALVLVVVKLAGSVHAEEASGYARDAGKPCVFLKAGYNPEQIAEVVLQQASEQLAQTVSPR
jgi:hypothetical protein